MTRHVAPALTCSWTQPPIAVGNVVICEWTQEEEERLRELADLKRSVVYGALLDFNRSFREAATPPPFPPIAMSPTASPSQRLGLCAHRTARPA